MEYLFKINEDRKYIQNNRSTFQEFKKFCLGLSVQGTKTPIPHTLERISELLMDK